MSDFRSTTNKRRASTRLPTIVGFPPDKGLFDLHRPPTTIILTSFSNYGLFDLGRQTKIFLTFVTRQLRSFRPLSPDNGLSNLRHSPTMVLSTSVTRQRSF
ncbi:hypothetical protein KFK09_016433 [Dendrobium nobile]|uniref:Uncharacterized protein n=1 Tax=Dendrobium nobile TaxID=94219 RepID=A0A8T3AZY0_DENNO|nr:hypothetical protein KFK09_016433 [Dendrobium nobile]